MFFFGKRLNSQYIIFKKIVAVLVINCLLYTPVTEVKAMSSWISMKVRADDAGDLSSDGAVNLDHELQLVFMKKLANQKLFRLLEKQLNSPSVKTEFEAQDDKGKGDIAVRECKELLKDLARKISCWDFLWKMATIIISTSFSSSYWLHVRNEARKQEKQNIFTGNNYKTSYYGTAEGNLFVLVTMAIIYKLAPKALRYGLTILSFKHQAFPKDYLLFSYIRKRHMFPEKTREYIENDLFYSFWQDQDDKILLSHLHSVVSTLLKLPLINRKIDYNPNMLESKLQFYPKKVKNQLKELYYSQVLNSKVEDKGRHEKIRFSYYLAGKPGMGKAYAVQQIAMAANSDLVHVNLDNATADDIFGTTEKPGHLLYALTAEANNMHDFRSLPFVLMDNFDRIQSQELLRRVLQLLDPEAQGFYSPFLHCWVKLPAVFLAGSPELKNDLTDRFILIPFTGYDKKAKQEILRTRIYPEAQKTYGRLQDQEHAINLDDPKIKEKILDATGEFIKNKDKDPGMQSALKFFLSLIKQHMMKESGSGNNS